MVLEEKAGFAFDTCVILKICQRNHNLADLLRCRTDFKTSKILINSKTLEEMERHGYGRSRVYRELSHCFGNDIVLVNIPYEVRLDARLLRELCPTLHSGDDEILAFSIATNSVLVTCDRGLIEAARMSGVSFINPDLLHREYSGTKIVKHEQSSILKPGMRIAWRMFV